jgi:hypothetical protein
MANDVYYTGTGVPEGLGLPQHIPQPGEEGAPLQQIAVTPQANGGYLVQSPQGGYQLFSPGGEEVNRYNPAASLAPTVQRQQPSAWYGGYGMLPNVQQPSTRYQGYGMMPAVSWANLSQLLGQGRQTATTAKTGKAQAQATPALSNQVPADEKNTVEQFNRSRFTQTSIEELQNWDAWNKGTTTEQPKYLSPAVANYLGISEAQRQQMGYSPTGVWDESRQMYVFPLMTTATGTGTGTSTRKPVYYYGGGGGGGGSTYSSSTPWWYWSSVNWRI